jgi:ABC-2 type transport system permease protein
MAGMNGTGKAAAGNGTLLGAQARAQYAAMSSLRWRMFINGLRSNLGAIELGARTVAFVIYAAMGLGLGAVLGLGAYALVGDEQWKLLPLLFWVVCFLWQVVPVMLASFQEQFDLNILLRFPVSFGSYLLLYIVFGLADISTIMGGLCCLGIWIGVTLARPDLSAWAALGLVVFALFNILLARAVFAWIDRWLAQRKTREILGAVFMVLLLSLQLLNPALRQRHHAQPRTVEERAESTRRMWAEAGPWMKTVYDVQQWLPPGLGARALRQVGGKAQPVPALASLGGLGLWALAAGGLLGWRLGAEYRGENLSSAPRRANSPPIAAHPTRRQSAWRFAGSGPIAAVMEKEVRALLRTLPLLWSLGVPVLMVLLLGGVFRNNSASTISAFPFALPLCVAYALLGFTQFIYNSLGTEGAGIQLLFFSPTPIRTVFLAKNLLHALFFGLDALLAAIMVSLRLGRPDGIMAAATAAWVLFALPCSLAVGDIFSLTMPYRINPGRITRQRGSQANNLLSLLTQFLLLGVGVVVFGLCWFLHRTWLAVPVFLALAAAAFFAWMRVLGNVDRLANQRRDRLVDTLMKDS